MEAESTVTKHLFRICGFVLYSTAGKLLSWSQRIKKIKGETI